MESSADGAAQGLRFRFEACKRYEHAAIDAKSIVLRLNPQQGVAQRPEFAAFTVSDDILYLVVTGALSRVIGILLDHDAGVAGLRQSLQALVAPALQGVQLRLQDALQHAALGLGELRLHGHG